MRKGQEKILKTAQEQGLSEVQIRFLSREDMSLARLNAAALFFCCHKDLNEPEFFLSYEKFIRQIETEYREKFPEMYSGIPRFCQNISVHDLCLVMDDYYTQRTDIIHIFELLRLLEIGADMETAKRILENLISRFQDFNDVLYIIKYLYCNRDLQKIPVSNKECFEKSYVTPSVIDKVKYTPCRVSQTTFTDAYRTWILEETFPLLAEEYEQHHTKHIFDQDIINTIMNMARAICGADMNCNPAVKETSSGILLDFGQTETQNKEIDITIAGHSYDEQPYQIDIQPSISGINLKLQKYSEYKILCNKDNQFTVLPFDLTYEIEMLFLYDGNALYRAGKYAAGKRWRPMTLKDLGSAYYYQWLSHLIDCIMLTFIDHGYTVWKDLMPYIKNSEYRRLFPPVKIHDIYQCKTKAMMMEKCYKNSGYFNWNKKDLAWCYAGMKAFQNIRTSDIGILKDFVNRNIDIKQLDKVYDTMGNNGAAMLSLILHQRTNTALHGENSDYISDYVKLSIQTRHKISISIRSINTIIDEHDHLVFTYKYQNIKKVEIPKNSKYNPLRKMLPENFEWIGSKKRLVHESTTMHHCVATYWKEINNDESAIYSFIWEEDKNRYTVQFILRNGHYQIVQIYGKYNQMCPQKAVEYVESFLN